MKISIIINIISILKYETFILPFLKIILILILTIYLNNYLF